MPNQPSSSSFPKISPFSINAFRHWRNACDAYGGADAAYRFKALQISLSSLTWWPLRAIEGMLYDRRIQKTSVTIPPIFIVGHWRSGTTHLHNLLTRDPQFAYINTFQCVAPSGYILGNSFLRPLMSRTMPNRRPMDNMALGVDLPQEEEFALSMLSIHSFYSAFSFPSRISELFEKYVLLEGLTADERGEWERVYAQVLQKTTYVNPGKRLVLKNPVNTARLSAIQALFPESRFVHIVRNPYSIFKSTERLFHSTIDMLTLQDYDPESIQPLVLDFYERMMKRYLEEKSRLDPNRLVELRYEDLIESPIDTLKGVYESLDLGGWGEAEPSVSEYLTSVKNHERNRSTLTDEEKSLVETRWGFALDRWGYRDPDSA